jgi:Protein of unknown function (DUF2806)
MTDDSDSRPIISATVAGDFSKPASMLIEKISEALGGAFRPWQIRRVAQAEADAAITYARAEIEITGLQRRAVERFLAEEAQKQANIEFITDKALPLLDAQAQPEKVEKDWITNFFDKCRLISDADMQTLWAKILAGEANAPGKFSKRTIDLLESFDKSDATLFSELCRFVIHSSDEWMNPYLLTYDGISYASHGLDFDSLLHLEDIGAVRVHEDECSLSHASGPVDIRYFDHRLTFDSHNTFINVGYVSFTQSGRELASVCNAIEAEDFWIYLKKNLSRQGKVTESE